MQGLLTRFSDLDAVFGANDPMALGAQLAAKQLKRTNIIITGVDGAPDTEKALADPGFPDQGLRFAGSICHGW